jgi:hypothetical protein
MKLRYFIAAAAAALTIIFSGCTKSKADEQAAVQNFKKEAESLDGWMKEKQKESGRNPMAGLAMMKELVAKLKAMKSDDLPADLKDAWGDFVAKIGKMESLLAEMGANPAEMIKKAASDPQFMQTFGERMRAIETEVKPAADRLREVGKKYGLEKIGDLAQPK